MSYDYGGFTKHEIECGIPALIYGRYDPVQEEVDAEREEAERRAREAEARKAVSTARNAEQAKKILVRLVWRKYRKNKRPVESRHPR